MDRTQPRAKLAPYMQGTGVGDQLVSVVDDAVEHQEQIDRAIAISRIRDLADQLAADPGRDVAAELVHLASVIIPSNGPQLARLSLVTDR